MRRRDLIGGGAAFIAARRVNAHQKAMPVVGYLSGVSPGPYAALVAAFRRGLRDGGYAEGVNVAIEYRWAEGEYNRLPALAADLVSRNVDLIAASGGTVSAHAAKNATSILPIVFLTGNDPVAEGLVHNLARPGGNLTGFTLMVDQLMEKRLDLLSDLVPQAKDIALLINPNNPNAGPLVAELPNTALSKGLRLHILKAGTESEIDAAFGALAQLPAGALVAGSDAFFNSRCDQIVALAAQRAIPAIYDTPAFTDAGGLLTYGPSLDEGYLQLGVYAGKVLQGAKPADLPVQQPTRVKLVLNLKTAKALGLTVPQSLLTRADEVIE